MSLDGTQRVDPARTSGELGVDARARAAVLRRAAGSGSHDDRRPEARTLTAWCSHRGCRSDSPPSWVPGASGAAYTFTLENWYEMDVAAIRSPVRREADSPSPRRSRWPRRSSLASGSVASLPTAVWRYGSPGSRVAREVQALRTDGQHRRVCPSPGSANLKTPRSRPSARRAWHVVDRFWSGFRSYFAYQLAKLAS